MQGTMSENLCEALMKMPIRAERRTAPRWSANLWLNMANPRLCKDKSMCETSKCRPISKRRYGMEAEGSPEHEVQDEKQYQNMRMPLAIGVQAKTSAEGAESEKMIGRIHKTYHPNLGCSGSLSSTETVHFVNVGTSCFGGNTGLAAVDVRHEGRESRSSLSQGKPDTWRRTLASCKSGRK
jgi:hypothetical protein